MYVFIDVFFPFCFFNIDDLATWIPTLMNPIGWGTVSYSDLPTSPAQQHAWWLWLHRPPGSKLQPGSQPFVASSKGSIIVETMGNAWNTDTEQEKEETNRNKKTNTNKSKNNSKNKKKKNKNNYNDNNKNYCWSTVSLLLWLPPPLPLPRPPPQPLLLHYSNYSRNIWTW